MILAFPNFDTLRLALTAGGIPEAVRSASARAFFDDQGRAWIEPSVPVADAAVKELQRLGVASSESSPQPLDQAVTCWPQLLPLQREPLDRLDDKTPVLFHLCEENQLAELVSEILRLGNDRQGYRWLAEGEHTGALLRVVGPPYYSLLRALDAGGVLTSSSASAFREAQPGVWVQLGYRHPLEEHLRPPAGKLLLMRPPRSWSFVSEAPFHDIYEVIDFAAPEPLAAWQDTELGKRWTVPLRLVKAGTMEPAELWVLRDGNTAQVDEFVQNADDQLLARLAFAVGEKNGQRLVVLRVRPSRQPPPVIVLGGIGYRPHLRLPNLFLPCSTRLHPPLRRDIVARLLAADSRKITWLHPGDDGRFTPETLPDSAFRPMHDWLDYVIDQEAESLTAWVQATRFDFEPFVCSDDQPARKPEPREPKSKKPKAPVDSTVEAETEPDEQARKTSRKKKDVPASEEAVPIKPSEAEETLRAVEKEFIESTASLDSPQRQALWPRMAQLNGVLGQTDSAGICWGHALWETDQPPAAWFSDWVRVENPRVKSLPSAEDIEKILDQETPSLSEVRFLLIAVVWAGQQKTLPAGWQRLLGRIPHMLEKHESILGIRVLWLAWTALHRLTHGDVLALARARDRLLERLYVNGLSPDLDLPNFLRFTGARASERHRLVRDQLLRLLPLAEKFTQRGGTQLGSTTVYLDLMFAYALARLGDSTQARKLLQHAPQRLSASDEVHEWLIAAFAYRIQQALEGGVAAGQLPRDLLDRLDEMKRDEKQRAKEAVPYEHSTSLRRYIIDRMREHSRILEPHEKVDATQPILTKTMDDLGRELLDLGDLDRAELLKHLTGLLGGKGKWARPKGSELRILTSALDLAPRLGDAFAEVVLEHAEVLLGKWPQPRDKIEVLEKSLFLAGHFDKSTAVQNFIARFLKLLHEAAPQLDAAQLDSLLGQAFHSLRKLGLRDEVGRLLERLTDLIQQHPAFKSRSAGGPLKEGMRNQLLLQVAGGWYYYGLEERARKLLDDARTQLFGEPLYHSEQTALACAYVRALGQAPIDFAITRIMELFRKVEGVHDNFTTSKHYSQAKLAMVETTLLALVSDDFTVAPEARRLLDDDEYLVRRRIHRDVRRAMEG